MNADNTATKIMNGQNFIRSAITPDMIDAAVATKTTWKKKSDNPEWSPSEIEPYIIWYPIAKNARQLKEYRQIFFVRIAVVFLVRTKPASNIENPAAIKNTKTPDINNRNVFRIY